MFCFNTCCRGWHRTIDLRVSPRRSAFTELHDTHFVYTPTSPSQTGIIAALFAGVIDNK